MPTRKREPARRASAPLNRAAMRARRWAAVGRELERCDPGRRSALLVLATQIVRAHRKSNTLADKRARDLTIAIRRRFTRR